MCMIQRSNWDTNTKSLSSKWALRFWGAYLLKLDVFFVHPTLIPLPTRSDFYVQLRGQNGWEGKRKGKWIHDRGHYGAFLIWRRMIFQSLRSGTMHLHLDLWLEKASQTLMGDNVELKAWSPGLPSHMEKEETISCHYDKSKAKCDGIEEKWILKKKNMPRFLAVHSWQIGSLSWTLPELPRNPW